MKHRAFFFLTIILSFVYSKGFSQTDWFLDNSRTSFNTTLIDSITFTKEGDTYVQNFWQKGQIIEKEEIEEGYTFEPKEVPLKYEYCSFEENDMECILTESGLYAILQHTPDSTGYILTNGNVNDESYSCIFFDSLGHVSNVKTSDNRLFHVIYTPNEMWLIDSFGKIVAEIPYVDFDNKEEASEANRSPLRKASTTDFTQTSTYKALSISDRIYGYLENPWKAVTLDLTNYIFKGIGKRNGELIAKFIAAGFNLYDPFAWIGVVQTANELYYFGNAKITALDAISEGCCSFITPCKVEGFVPTIKELFGRYGNTLNYSYTLKMSAQTASVPHKEKQSKTRKIDGDGTFYDFKFDFKELQTEYMYEPSLTLEASFKGEYIDEKNMRLAELGLPYSTESGHTYHINCTIKGNPNSLFTGSVSSTVEKVNNVKTTTADIICSFSNIPNGAQCVVSVSREGSDIALTFNGTPGKNSQIVKATGLTINTKYVATSYITYNGRVYYGLKSVDFTTSGPSGNVLSIDASTITTTSAVAKCSFSGMDSGAECGIIAKSGSQTLTFKASSKDGEQDVSLTGLKPGTHYECWAYVKLPNYYKQFDNSVSFTTKSPGITGTWNCVEEYDWRPFPGAEWQTKTRNYTITLNDDGSMSVKGLEDYIGGSWGYSSSGYFNATAHIIATQTQNTWDRFEGNVDSVENPTTITGVRYRGNMNQFAYSEDVAGRITMTR